MQFDWPTPDQMIYRISRLRRLVALAVAIPVAILLLGSLIDPGFIGPDRATMAAIAVALLVSGHVALFPNVPLETISLSIAVTVLALAAPGIKSLSLLAPPEYVSAALIMLVVLAVVAAGALMMLLQIGLGLLMVAGPVLRLRLRGSIDVPCSPSVARRQFALQPNARRGRILTGTTDKNGFFDVAIIAPQVADPENPAQAMVVRVAAKVIEQSDSDQQTMLVLPNGAVTVTSERFTPIDGGCRVEITELPGDFTLGMYAMFWLTDQQMDNLTETADLIAGGLDRANGQSHGVSFLAVAGAVLSPRQPVADRAE